jgi:hypothetical protein
MMSNVRLLTLLTACLLSSLGLAATSALAAEGDFLYDSGTVNVLEMTLPQAGIEGLENDPFTYQKGGTVMVTPTDGTPGGKGTPSKTFQNVEIKLKGQLQGSFQDLGHKAAFKLKFKKTEPFFGLRKLTLNNMTQDPSMVHESLAYAAFGAAGVPASRSGYAYVWLNGENFGLHLNLESLDETSLTRIFGTPFDKAKQHLYEAAEYGADFYPGKESRFEVDEGEPDTSDLTALIAAVDAGGSGAPPSSLSTLVDLNEMTRMWGVEKYIGHWDGYAGKGIPGEEEFNEHRPNNYYLYTEPSGRFQMLPWGTDQTWDTSETGGVPLEFDEQDGRLFDLCLEDEACAGMFSAAVAAALEKVGQLDLGALAEDTAAMLKPWQDLEQAPHKAPYSSSQAAAAVDETLDFIADRPAEAEAWLAEHPPPVDPPPVDPPSGEGLPVEKPATGQPAADSASPPLPADPPTASAIGIEKGDRVARLRLHVGAPGDLLLTGSAALDGRRKRVCRELVYVDVAGEVVLTCRLSPRALRRLRHHALPIELRLTFTPDGAAPPPITREITLRRDAA